MAVFAQGNSFPWGVWHRISSITSCREDSAVILLLQSSYWKNFTGCQGPTFSHILCLCTDIVDSHKAECRTFYDELSSLIIDIPLRDYILICGDLNAQLAADGCRVKNMCGKPNSNSEALQAFINLHDLIVLPIFATFRLSDFCVLPVAVTGSPNLLCCILRYFIDFAFCCCAI